MRTYLPRWICATLCTKGGHRRCRHIGTIKENQGLLLCLKRCCVSVHLPSGLKVARVHRAEPSYLLSQCKYQSLAPPLSCCWELRSAFSSTPLVSSRSCASFPSSELHGGHGCADVCCRPPLLFSSSFTAGGLLVYVSVPPVNLAL